MTRRPHRGASTPALHLQRVAQILRALHTHHSIELAARALHTDHGEILAVLNREAARLEERAGAAPTAPTDAHHPASPPVRGSEVSAARPAPAPLAAGEDAGAWRRWLPFETATPVQEGAIPALLTGRDLITTAKTGSGKTLAFLIPAAARGIGMNSPRGCRPEVLIISPTRELAVQSRDVARELGMPAGRITGGISASETRSESSGKGVVSGTPGRLKDLLRRGELLLGGLRYLVLDEADELLSLGFLRDVTWIAEEGLRQARVAGAPRPQLVLASATFPAEIRAVAERLLEGPLRVDIAPPQRDSGETEMAGEAVHRVIDTTRAAALRDAATIIETQLTAPGGCVVVFCRTKALVKRRAEALGDLLPDHEVVGLQGNLDQRKREAIMDGLRTGRARVLVATDIAGRGIDLPEVREVIHLDVSSTAEHHTHRSGRTARGGRSGVNTVLLIPEQRALWQKVRRGLPAHLQPARSGAEDRIDAAIQEKTGKGSGNGAEPMVSRPKRRR